MGEASGVFVFILLVALYFLPTAIAAQRQHKNIAPIAIINIFTGWTFIGWVICLAWSASNQE